MLPKANPWSETAEFRIDLLMAASYYELPSLRFHSHTRRFIFIVPCD